MLDADQERHVFTIGHSHHTLERFFALLKEHAIRVLVDIRSHPYSKYASQFNKESLAASAKGHDVKYLFLGRELGGQPDDPAYYDVDGRVLYSRLAQSDLFAEGIRRILQGIQRYEVALMCSEEDPTDCHRRLLVGRCLARQSVTVWHIRGDGGKQAEQEIADFEQGQLPLFGPPEEAQWRSTRSVSRKEQPPISSQP